MKYPEQCVLSDNEMITWFIYGLYLGHLQMPLDLAAVWGFLCFCYEITVFLFDP